MTQNPPDNHSSSSPINQPAAAFIVNSIKLIMGVTGSKVFVNRMLRNSVGGEEEDGNNLLRHTGHSRRQSEIQYTNFEDSIDHQLSNGDDEEDEAYSVEFGCSPCECPPPIKEGRTVPAPPKATDTMTARSGTASAIAEKTNFSSAVLH